MGKDERISSLKNMKILIVKTSAIGDVIHTLPIIEELKKRYPTAEIDWVVEKSCFDFLTAHSALSRVLLADMKSWRKKLWKKAIWKEMAYFLKRLRHVHYDLLFDFQGNTKSALVTWFARAQTKVGFGWHSLPEKLNYFVTHTHYDVPAQVKAHHRYLSLLEAYFRDTGCRKKEGYAFELTEVEKVLVCQFKAQPLMQHSLRLMIAFGSKWKNKKLDDATLKAFLNKIQQKYEAHFFFPYGNEEEKEFAESLHGLFPETSHVMEALSLQAWRACMMEVDGVIAMDSAALHLCATTKTPSFSFFGPTASVIYKPEGEHHLAIQGACPYGKTFEVRCPLLRSCATGACLKELPVDQIVESFDKWALKLQK